MKDRKAKDKKSQTLSQIISGFKSGLVHTHIKWLNTCQIQVQTKTYGSDYIRINFRQIDEGVLTKSVDTGEVNISTVDYRSCRY